METYEQHMQQMLAAGGAHECASDCPLLAMTEDRVPTRSRKRGGYIPGPDCALCGYKANNVRHEQDPEHAPEGFDYFRPFLHELHEFVARDD